MEVERSGGFSAGDLIKIIEIVRQNQTLLFAEWDKYYPTR